MTNLRENSGGIQLLLQLAFGVADEDNLNAQNTNPKGCTFTH